MNAHLSQVLRGLLRFVEMRSAARRSLALGELPLARRRPLEPVPGERAGEPTASPAASGDRPRRCCHV
jgi:hypothetical protein